MQFFLCDDGVEGVEHVFVAVTQIVACDFIGEVVDEFGEVGDFEEFVESDELEVFDAFGA
jgi:hypothetical protein